MFPNETFHRSTLVAVHPTPLRRLDQLSCQGSFAANPPAGGLHVMLPVIVRTNGGQLRVVRAVELALDSIRGNSGCPWHGRRILILRWPKRSLRTRLCSTISPRRRHEAHAPGWMP